MLNDRYNNDRYDQEEGLLIGGNNFERRETKENFENFVYAQLVHPKHRCSVTEARRSTFNANTRPEVA